MCIKDSITYIYLLSLIACCHKKFASTYNIIIFIRDLHLANTLFCSVHKM